MSDTIRRITTVVIFTHPTKRVAELGRTLDLLLARTTGLIPVTVWTGGRPPEVSPQQDIQDVFDLIHSPQLAEGDLVFLEDDIEPCRNALNYMVNWQSRYLTSFYNPYRPYGLNHGFIFSQAFKVPQELLQRMRAEPFPPPHPKLQRDGIDQVFHRYLTRWKMPFYQHRSLVQHVGEVSTWTVSKLSQPGRRSIDWPGPDFDALTLPGGANAKGHAPTP